MKILISDVWSVYNAGDRAILEGLLDGLRDLYPGAELTVAAHFPEGCEEIPGIRVIPDVLAFDEASYLAQLAMIDGTAPRLDALKAAYTGSDLVVSTGGYFLNATPGNPFTYVYLSRLLHFDWAIAAGVPVAVVGQSLGPIEGGLLRAASRATLSRLGVLAARDVQSFACMLRAGLAPRVELTADLAVELAPAPAEEVRATMQRLSLPTGALGISVRHYPGTPAGAFRDIARVADRVVREFGLPILLIGTTVPPAGKPEVQRRERELGNDDSLALREVHALMRERDSAVVCAESLPPRLLKGVLGTCRAFVSTRMHAAILASTAGVPVAGLAYEFKVTGWFERLGLQDFVLPLSAVNYARLWPVACRLLAETNEIERHLARVVPSIQGLARRNFTLLGALAAPTGALPEKPRSAPRGEQPWAPIDISKVQGADDEAAATEPGPSVESHSVSGVAPVNAAGLSAGDPRRAWEKESAHYDVLHRRLRRIVELAERTGGTRLLDVGCSAGTVGAALSPRWHYHGCDVSESAVRSARRGWLMPADLENGVPAFDEQPYDVIVCSGILEYLENPAKLLQSLSGRLATGGRLVVSYFNMRHVSRRSGGAYRHPLWRNDYSPAEFRHLLAESGWEIETTTWSTAGAGTAPDVRAEEAAVRAEPADVATRLDDLAHTLIYVARPRIPVAITTRTRMPASVVIPAFNRQDLLTPVLEAFAAHRARSGFEVVVVDDGSETPVRIDGLGERFRLRRQENRGRAAAVNAGIDLARGEVVVVCDSDIVPDAGFLDAHLRFHQSNPAETATHLGDLVWGVEAGPLGDMLGARANPRLKHLRGNVSWTTWFTDNWSFKRALFDRHAFRFDTAFRKWGWEELELAHRLAAAGATSTATGTATGRHMKPVTVEGLLRCFSVSVPNLLHLADKVGPVPAVQGWLAMRFDSPELFAASGELLQLAVKRIESAWNLAPLPGEAGQVVATGVSDALFRHGIQSGFHALGKAPGTPNSPEQSKARLLEYADLVGCALVLEKYSGGDAHALLLATRDLLGRLEGGALLPAFEKRAHHQVNKLAQLLGNQGSSRRVERPVAVPA